jgi:hypothetical protein
MHGTIGRVSLSKTSSPRQGDGESVVPNGVEVVGAQAGSQ